MNKAQGNFFFAPMVKVWMKTTGGIFTTRSVSDLLWGYEDPLLKKVSGLKKSIEKDFGFMIHVSFFPHRSHPEAIPEVQPLDHEIFISS